METPKHLAELENNLNEYIQCGDCAVDEEKFKNEFQKLDKFISYYDDSHIDSMNFDDYCLGKGNNNSFCNIVERKLWYFGSIRGGSSNKFGLYWSKRKNSYIKNGSPITEVEAKRELEKSKKCIKEIKKIAQNKEVKLNNGFENINIGQGDAYKNKLYFLFDVNNQIPIYSAKHLKRILIYFDLIPKEANKSTYEMRIILYDFYKNYVLSNERFINITPTLFTSFLYREERDGYYPYRNILLGGGKTDADAPDIIKDQKEHVYEVEDINDIEEETTEAKTETKKKDFTQQEVSEIYQRNWRFIEKHKVIDKNTDKTNTENKKRAHQVNSRKPDQPYIDRIGKLGENIIKKQLELLVKNKTICQLKDTTNQYSEGYDFSLSITTLSYMLMLRVRHRQQRKVSIFTLV